MVVRFHSGVLAINMEFIFDQYILHGNHFKFLYAEYKLKKLKNGNIELLLSCSYQLNSHVNQYGAFCGKQVLLDFQ
jgi:hypothetical protein